MFTQVEENYILALINSYKKDGYNYYLAHTVTETDNNYDIYIYFSKEEIVAISNNIFDLSNCICVRIDSSSRNDNSYNTSTHSRSSIINSNYSDVLTINQAEFIYTNAKCTYDKTSIVVNPDITMQSSNSLTSIHFMGMCVFVLVATFLYRFIINILRLRK